MVTVAAVVASVAACSVPGQPIRTPDLSALAVLADAFPYGPGLPVQDPKSPLIGTFEDRVVLTGDGWRFAERTGGLDFRP